MRFTLVHHQELENMLNRHALDKFTMRLDEVQAFVCAMISGPDCCDLSLWLPEILGGVNLYTQAEELRIGELVHCLAEDLRLQMNANLAPELILYKNEFLEDDYLTWCNAYLCALDLTETDWFAQNMKETSELVYPLAVLGGVFDENEAVQKMSDDIKIALKQQLPHSILSIYQYWQNEIKKKQLLSM